MRRNTDQRMSIFKHTLRTLGVMSIALMFTSCGTSDPLSPGIEYMPDMYRSPAIEEYVDYGEIKDRINDSLAVLLSARKPVDGTIPYSEDGSKAHYNYPYPYENTVEGYELAGAELLNPIQFTEEVYLQAQADFEIFCIHCHGEKGDGQGSLVKSGKFAAPPAYQGNELLTQGKMFHTLMFGKGNMGSHAGQLSREERWQLVHYVQTLKDGKFDDPFAVATEESVTEEESPANEEQH